jgi:putative membrane protein
MVARVDGPDFLQEKESHMREYLAIAALLAGLTAVATAAVAQEATGTTASAASQLQQADMQFVQEAAGGGQAEVELGKLAGEKAESPDVKQFGQMMVNDHTKANEQLMKLAQEKKLQLPSDVPSEAKSAKEKLTGLSGREFDREYMKQMVADHEKTVELFQKQADRGQDTELKQFAQQTLPTLQHHLEQAKQIDTQMSEQAGATSTSGTGAKSDASMESTEPAAGTTSSQQATRTGSSFGQMTAEELIGKTVVTSNGEDVGEIEDIVLNREDKAVLAVISVGGFLGIGEKDVVVPFNNLKQGEKEAILMTAATEEQLKNMPAYKKGDTTYDVYPRDQPLGGNQ